MIPTAVRLVDDKRLRYPSPWFSLLCLGPASVLAFLPLGGPDYPQLVGDSLDALHFPVGALLFVCIARLIESSSIRSWCMALAMTAIAVIGVELLQGLVGRNADPRDALLGLAGAIGSAVILSRTRALSCEGARYSAYWLVFALVASCGPIAIDWLNYSRMALQPAFIADFESVGSGRLWRAEWGSSSRPPLLQIAERNGNSRALEVLAREGGWSGASIEVPIHDSHTRGLTFSIQNPGKPFQLIVRMLFVGPQGRWSSDAAVQVRSGWNHIDVTSPISRSHNEANRLREVLFYVKTSDIASHFYLDDVWRLRGG